ncbi:Chromatin modification-related protein, partial [Lachnellula hyalina]
IDFGSKGIFDYRRDLGISYLTKMAPSKSAAAAPPFSKNERVLCFHHDMLYEAVVLESRATEDNTSWQYKIHYKGWKHTVIEKHGGESEMEEGGRHFQIKTAWLESEELRFHFALHLHLLLKPAFFNLHLLGAGLRKMHRSLKDVVNPPDHVTNNQWDDWVPQDRVREFTPENKELAAQLHTQMKALQKIPRSAVKKGGKTNGSDFSSTRGSEERHTSAAAPGGRGPRRNRDYDLEHVSIPQFTFFVFVFVEIMDAVLSVSLTPMTSAATLPLSSPSLSPLSSLGPSGDEVDESDATDTATRPLSKRPREDEAPVSPPAKRARRIIAKEGVATRSTKTAIDAPWSIPGNPEWDVQRVLNTEDLMVDDYLLKLPDRNFSYIANNGRLKNPDFYGQFSQTKTEIRKRIHPKLQEHINKKTDTPAVYRYYKDLPHNITMPIAGIIFEDKPADIAQVSGPSSEGYPSEKASVSQKPVGITKPRKVAWVLRSPEPQLQGSEVASESDNWRFTLVPLFPDRKRSERKPFEKEFSCEIIRNARRKSGQFSNKNQEETFHARPSIQLPIPDHVKAILVDDWENVTKNQQLVPLPSTHPVSEILDDYYNYESPRRVEGSSHADILEEVIAGLKDYFEKCLGRVLLYRFERAQYTEVRTAWGSSQGPLSGKSAVDTYGAEHLSRLLVSLPELIAQTNMDQQSVNRLREELIKLTTWLGKNAEKYFVKEYETPGADYVEKARGGV